MRSLHPAWSLQHKLKHSFCHSFNRFNRLRSKSRIPINLFQNAKDLTMTTATYIHQAEAPSQPACSPTSAFPHVHPSAPALASAVLESQAPCTPGLAEAPQPFPPAGAPQELTSSSFLGSGQRLGPCPTKKALAMFLALAVQDACRRSFTLSAVLALDSGPINW